MLHNFCLFSPDYPALLRKLKDPLNIRTSSAIIQWPFAVPVVEEKTEEELERLKERRKEQGRKLQEMAAAKREQKVCILPCL
jgi:actin-related protein 5